jgi:hypothetical protein
MHINIHIHTYDRDMQRKEWIRDLKTRMYRENLLGKKMINT